ncbi:MAG: efflux RND transporter periplasmic adaptor subunit [Nannocystaceae bacterium]
MRRSLVLSLVLAVAGCGPAEAGPERRAPGPASSPSAWSPVTAPEDVALLEAPARAVLDGDREAAIRPLFRAQILRFHVRAGDRVEAGAPIVDVIMPEVAHAAAVYRGATARGAVQGGRRDKLKALRGEGLTTEGALYEVRTQAASSAQEVLVAAATLRSAGVDPGASRRLVDDPKITLTSPIGGVVRELRGRVGAVVEAEGEAIAAIVGDGPPRIEARFLHEPPAGAALRFEAVSGATWRLDATPLARVVEADDGAVILWFAVADPELRAFPGLRGVVVAAVADDPTLVQVPVDAVIGRGDAPRVFRRRGDAVEPVAVELVTATGATALVRARERDALVAGDRVADDGRAVERDLRRGEGV